MRDEVLSSPAIWLCLECYRCYARCPQKVNFTDIMKVLRYLSIKGNYVPAEKMKEIDDLDRFIQEIRCSFIKQTFKPNKEKAEKIKLKIEEKLKSISSAGSGKKEASSSVKEEEKPVDEK